MHPEFASFETLAAFIDDRLDARARQRVSAHLTTCTDCYETFIDVSAARREIGEADFEPRPFAAPQPEPGRANVLPFRLWIAAAAIAAAVAAVFFVPAIREWVPGLRTPDVEDLARAASADAARATEARLDGFDVHQAPKLRTRGGRDGESDDVPPAGNPALLADAALIDKAAAVHPTPRNRHARGVAELLRGNRDEAIDDLEAAKASSGERPAAGLLNDLAAAYLDRAGFTGSTADYVQALDYAERVPQPNRVAAWNRALALQGLHRTQEAVAAWQHYLMLERDPEWRREASARMARARQE
jgi:tetratricopeptide (TPR) repeat protein